MHQVYVGSFSALREKLQFSKKNKKFNIKITGTSVTPGENPHWMKGGYCRLSSLQSQWSSSFPLLLFLK